MIRKFFIFLVTSIVFIIGCTMVGTGFYYLITNIKNVDQNRSILYDKYPKLTPELYLIIKYNAKKNNLPESLVCSLIQDESNWKQYALSKSGAKGYMQIMPVHHPHDPKELYNPYLNIEKGCMYLRRSLDASKKNTIKNIKSYVNKLEKSNMAPEKALQKFNNKIQKIIDKKTITREAIRMYNQGIHGKRWKYKNWEYVDSVLGRL